MAHTTKRASEIEVGDVVSVELGKVVSIEIKDKGARILKLSTKKRVTVADTAEVIVKTEQK